MSQAGLFSAVASAFIIEVNSQLQPNPNEETAALLRVLIHKIDNTAFGNDVPAVPQWAGPPHMIVQVQAILFGSLSISLFTVFLALLGKQWLNRYASVNMRRSAIERSQDRQQKLDGVDSWYFYLVAGSLLVMSQAALLLLGCALSRYLWEINTTVALAVLGVTLFGVLFYLLIVIAGTSSVNCPYQTPLSHIICHIPDALLHILDTSHHALDIFCCILDISYCTWENFHHTPHAPGALHPVIIRESTSYSILIRACNTLGEGCNSLGTVATSLLCILLLPIWLILDACRAIIWLLVAFSHWVYIKLQQQSEQLHLQWERDQQVAVLDLRCISWILRTSLDRHVRLSTLNYLATTAPADFDPTLVVDCFDTLFGCVIAIDGKATITQGSEQLATASALCSLHTISHLISIDPTPRVEDICQQYARAFRSNTNFNGLPVFYTMNTITSVLFPHYYSRAGRQVSGLSTWWDDYKPSSNEHAIVAHALTRIAQLEYQRTDTKVPRWLLRFALHSLSQYPLPLTSVILNSLSIVAIDLGCGPTNTTTLEERCVCI